MKFIQVNATLRYFSPIKDVLMWKVYEGNHGFTMFTRKNGDAKVHLLLPGLSPVIFFNFC